MVLMVGKCQAGLKKCIIKRRLLTFWSRKIKTNSVDRTKKLEKIVYFNDRFVRKGEFWGVLKSK